MKLTKYVIREAVLTENASAIVGIFLPHFKELRRYEQSDWKFFWRTNTECDMIRLLSPFGSWYWQSWPSGDNFWFDQYMKSFQGLTVTVDRNYWTGMQFFQH